MTPIQILAQAASDHVEITWMDGKLYARPTPSPGLTRTINTHRTQLIAHLAGTTCDTCGEPCHPGFNPHPACDPTD